MSLLDRILQILFDVAFGLAVYFLLETFASVLGQNVIVIITLVATAIFSENVEMMFKPLKHD